MGRGGRIIEANQMRKLLVVFLFLSSAVCAEEVISPQASPEVLLQTNIDNLTRKITLLENQDKVIQKQIADYKAELVKLNAPIPERPLLPAALMPKPGLRSSSPPMK